MHRMTSQKKRIAPAQSMFLFIGLEKDEAWQPYSLRLPHNQGHEEVHSIPWWPRGGGTDLGIGSRLFPKKW